MQPNPVFLPGKSHGQRSLAGYRPWGRKESDMTEQLNMPGGLVSENLPCNAEDVGLIPGQGTKTPHAPGQLRSRGTTRKNPACHSDDSTCHS